MLANHIPMIVLGAIVVATLVYKGYIPLNGLLQARPAPAARPTVIAMTAEPQQVHGEATPEEARTLTRLDSQTLGVYFALARRREAEAQVAHDIARLASDTIGATFSAPFSPPGGPTSPAAPSPGGRTP